MMQLQVLRVDHNELSSLPNEVGDLQMLSELTFSDNKIQILPSSLQRLKQLKMLNFSDNQVKHLPSDLGELKSLKQLYLHGNRFACFPCSFVNVANTLDELSLEWFMYAKPPRSKLVKREHQDGKEIFDQLIVLCNLLQKYKMNECALVTFLENYSSHVFNINSIDNRLRTPLHNAAVKGDNGVLEGLLLGKADANLLDKDNCTPLCLAIREENFDAAVVLINANVDVNLGGGIFGSPMHLAVVKLEVWIVKKLIMNGADVNKTDCDGNTPLHFVMNVFSKNPQKCMSIAELLIMSGAKVNIKNNDNWAPIHLAARKGQEKGIQTIIRLNNTLREKGLEQFDLNSTGGAQQWSAVHLAAHGGFIQIVRDLVAAGVDIMTRNQSNQLPRHCAKGNYILTKFLKLAEQNRIRSAYSTYQVHNQYELLQNVTQKKENSGALQKQGSFKKQSITSIAEEYSQNYDTFLNNLAQLKVVKAFTEIDIVKKGKQQSSLLQQSTNIHQQSSMTPSSSSHQNNDNNYFFMNNFGDFDLTQTMKSQVFSTSQEMKSDSKFCKLNMKAEEKKINLFYLKDILIKESTTQQDKLEALFKIKRNQAKPVFAAAMRSLLPELERIDDLFIQKEIIQAIQVSGQHQLLQPLRDLQKAAKLDESLKDDIEDAINALTLAQQKPKSYVTVHVDLNHGSSTLSDDKSRNVNSFKMKGMASLISNGGRGDILRSSAGTPVSMHQNHKLQSLLSDCYSDTGVDVRKSAQVLFSKQNTQVQHQQLMQTLPMRKVLGHQNGTAKSVTPQNNGSSNTLSGNNMQPPKVTQMLKKKQPNSKPLSSSQNSLPFSSSMLQKQKTQGPSQLSNLAHSTRIQYLGSAKRMQEPHHLDDDSIIIMEPSFEYNAKTDHQKRMNIMTRGVSQGNSGMRSHSHRNSLSIPAKK